ncbi:ATP-grasp domain-containing protein [Myceligenerans pegani]|uniref:ATP-grasp domain-containing protein n=1 Tax=Myceligenerans pegani TaxID=2776917 RepID=A0ABR9MSK8_9MICO|nr:ATP-grasp domain-containing protein [Myceligenerans sp. TRM 65318]MBE1874120.1 ATP-grasp domain-containing protein [Myceligenerans sp. TRM 65318]MBE3016392.1 ATP-grasp domain-containing protein [Myceligenerans sp. TRM 65318]
MSESDGRRRNVFVLGMTDLQREELESMRQAARYSFHPLLDYEPLVRSTDHDFDALLDEARAQLAEFPGPIDAIVCHWDFPSSLVAPILCHENDIPAPSVTSVLKCEHKYWSRLEQRRSVPEVVPGFTAFDPFADDALDQVELPYPFWVKPVKAHSSNLGFEIHDEREFESALDEIREEITGVGDAFNQVLSRVDLPESLRDAGGNTCLAEEIISGIQAAPEGVVARGRFSVHGVVDMHRNRSGHSIDHIDYPAVTVPAEVQQRMVDTAERFLRHIGYDDGAFNAEYMWHRETDRLRLIEVNTRISQSHTELFLKVDGTSNHEVAIDVALGEPPEMPHRQGPFAVAGQWHLFHDTDAIVRGVPGEEDLAALERALPGTKAALQVKPGDRLSDLPHQDSYRFRLGSVYLGADDHDQLADRFRRAVELLPFEFDPVPEEDPA